MGDSYAEISNTEADMQQTYLAQLMADTQWTFQNQTPFKIKLTYRPLHVDPAGSNLEYGPVFLGTLGKKQKKNVCQRCKRTGIKGWGRR